MIFAESTKLQHEVARRKGWHVEAVGVQFGLFSPDNILVGGTHSSSDAAWVAGLNSPTGVPKWARDLDDTWSLYDGSFAFEISLPIVEHTLGVRIGNNPWHQSHDYSAASLMLLLTRAWLDFQRLQEKSRVDHADA